jgi:hypothetical protein
MHVQTLVGQTVTLSTQNKEQGGYINRRLRILERIKKNGVHWYTVLQEGCTEPFEALASIYDRLFLVKRQPFHNQLYKGETIYSAYHPNRKA